jgi:hypothetical protein
MDMLSQVKSNRDKVKTILEKYPETRNSDKLLWLAYMCFYKELKFIIGEENYVKFRALLLQESTPTFESLTRARRKIQEEHELLQASQGTRSKRCVSERQMREYFKSVREGMDEELPN